MNERLNKLVYVAVSKCHFKQKFSLSAFIKNVTNLSALIYAIFLKTPILMHFISNFKSLFILNIHFI